MRRLEITPRIYMADSDFFAITNNLKVVASAEILLAHCKEPMSTSKQTVVFTPHHTTVSSTPLEFTPLCDLILI